MHRSAISLRTKIILLVGGMTCLAAALVGGINVFQIRKAAAEKTIERLARDAHLTALSVRNAYEEVKNDALIMIHAPAVQGFIRARRGGGVDSRDASTEAHWRGRLNLFFTSMMENRPHYRQIRYVGLEDDGRELVHVERQEDGRITATAPQDLRDAAGEAYFEHGARLPRDNVHYTGALYSQENTKVGSTSIPTIYGTVPVFGESGYRFGMLIISVNYTDFLARAVRYNSLSQALYVGDAYGRYFQSTPDGKVFVPPSPDIINNVARLFNEVTTGNVQEANFPRLEHIWYGLRESISPGQLEYFINVFTATPDSEVWQEANALADYNIVLGLAIVFAATLAAGLWGNRLVSPISNMTKQINAFREGSANALNLPTNKQDEVGKLALAFQDLVARLDLSNRNRAIQSFQLKEFINNSVDSVVIADERGVIEEVNPACLALFGYEYGELIGKNVSLLMPQAVGSQHDDYLRTYRDTGIRNLIGSIRDEHAQRKDGSVFPIALSINELKLPDRRIFTALIRDMAAIRAIQQKLESYTAELERSNRDLNQFAYVASHDLKAPLRVIHNASRWLEEDLGDKLTGDNRENMTLLRSRVRRMEKLLDDLLTYAQIGREGNERDEEIIDGATLIDDLLVLAAPPKSFKVNVSSAFRKIVVNRMPLQQIFCNLIGNAIKHHDRESGLIEIDAAEGGGHLRFTVRDDGPGIPAQFHEQIFEMFRTLKPRDQVEGSGMGLAMVRRHIEHLGGTITVKSGHGRGSEFTFTWPKNSPAKMSPKAA